MNHKGEICNYCEFIKGVWLAEQIRKWAQNEGKSSYYGMIVFKITKRIGNFIILLLDFVTLCISFAENYIRSMFKNQISIVNGFPLSDRFQYKNFLNNTRTWYVWLFTKYIFNLCGVFEG